MLSLMAVTFAMKLVQNLFSGALLFDNDRQVQFARQVPLLIEQLLLNKRRSTVTTIYCEVGINVHSHAHWECEKLLQLCEFVVEEFVVRFLH